ncbi:MAG: response regulator [Desulfoprunum sp.]|nr:response regulator [Desulfoprunum sp.]
MRPMAWISQSIPVKISLAILIIETVLLAVMGIFYSSRFSQEIEQRITEKLALPGILMNQRAMPYDAVQDFRALSDLVQEKVVEACIFQQSGTVFFTADPAREGRSFTDFLGKEEKNSLGKDIRHARQISFTAETGEHFIAKITPLLTNTGDLLGGLYVKISAEAMVKKKREVVLFFCAGAFLTIVLTTLIEALVVHRLFIPRMISASTVLKKYGGGDFSARIDHFKADDQLGKLMQQVNFLLETVAEYTRKLHALNRAGEVFARAGDKREILHIAAEMAEQHLSARVVKNGEGDHKILFTLPIENGKTGKDYSAMQFAGISDYNQLSSADVSFVYALSGLMASALDRLEAFQRIAEAEEKYRYLFAMAQEGIFRSSPEGKILDANLALATMRGFASVEEMISCVTDLAECYENPQERADIMQLLEKSDKFQEYEVNMKRRDGSIFPASMSARAVKDGVGTIQSIEGRIVDISERRLREKEKQARLATAVATQAKLFLIDDLEKKNKLLQEALDELKRTQLQLIQSEKMAAVGMTAGGVAHDLNNILTGVVSYPELLLLTLPADSEMRRPLEAILASGRRAVAVVADLLTLAQGSAREKQNAVLDSLVEEYLDSVEFKQMMRAYPDVQVSSIYEAGAMCIDCSPVHIQKVVMNLVMNAVEAVAPHNGSVTLRTWQTMAGPEGISNSEGFVVLEVRDDGPGIPPENRGRIFDPFYTRKVMGKKGTGLGLTVVWNVVREHEGRIVLDCDSVGTIFRIFLPAQKIAVPESSGAIAEVDLRGKGKILVVDDEPLQREIAGKILTVFGYEVAVVPSGEEAIAYLRQKSADLVILDMLMPPGMNGLQTYREIVALHPGQKALIVSGFSECSDVKVAIQLGVGGYVKKPYTMAQIGQAVKNELGRQAAGRNPSG